MMTCFDFATSSLPAPHLAPLFPLAILHLSSYLQGYYHVVCGMHLDGNQLEIPALLLHREGEGEGEGSGGKRKKERAQRPPPPHLLFPELGHRGHVPKQRKKRTVDRQGRP